MRAIRAKKIDVNLLGREPWAKTPFGKFLKWILSYGRYIIIGTEIIVLLAFLSRFKLDRDLTDLSDSIATKQAVVQASQELEGNVRTLQERLARIKDLEDKQINSSELLTLLTQTVPSEVTFTELSISQGKINLSGKSFSLNGFSVFLNNLLEEGHFREISLDKLSEEEEGGIKFSLTTVYQRGEN